MVGHHETGGGVPLMLPKSAEQPQLMLTIEIPSKFLLNYFPKQRWFFYRFLFTINCCCCCCCCCSQLWHGKLCVKISLMKQLHVAKTSTLQVSCLCSCHSGGHLFFGVELLKPTRDLGGRWVFNWLVATQIFLIFIPTWGKWSNLTVAYFSKGLKPPTS